MSRIDLIKRLYAKEKLFNQTKTDTYEDILNSDYTVSRIYKDGREEDVTYYYSDGYWKNGERE